MDKFIVGSLCWMQAPARAAGPPHHGQGRRRSCGLSACAM